ncbi:TIP41-like protein [Phytophthora citrophthora]|uniref:TIP41-like protein n=1 Tax=Phytophthora citrophthora TaxID=4793 RepID=A0AAD9GKR9_9STRA|nr:TIP41-like protein [Phytophthora citrophthora]
MPGDEERRLQEEEDGEEYEYECECEEVEIEEMTDDEPMHITSRLFLGSIDAARNVTALKRLRIGETLALLAIGEDAAAVSNYANVVSEVYTEVSINRTLIEIEDSRNGDLMRRLPEILSKLREIIAKAERNDTSVLVHCIAGRSRSAAVLAAWILVNDSKQPSVQDVVDRIRIIRPWIEINSYFMQDLHLFHTVLTLSDGETLATADAVQLQGRAFPRLDFGSNLVEGILGGTKSITMRLLSDIENDPKSDLGDIFPFSTVAATTSSPDSSSVRSCFAYLRIDKVETRDLNTIDDATLRKSGFESTHEVLSVLKQFYPNVTASTPLQRRKEDMASAGFYTLENGASELLQDLYKTTEGTSVPAKPEYLGDSRRENQPQSKADPVEHKGIRLHNWVIGSNKTHITPIDTVDEIGEAAKLTPPEMVFGKNQLVLYHESSGVCYNFLAVEALKGAHFPPPVSDQAQDIVANQQLKVSIAKHNTNKEDVKELDITYDWTYSTDYKGSLQRLTKSESSPVTFTKSEEDAKVEATSERINYEKLKEREPILWFEDVGLYEDELHDHGSSAMSVKVRVMPSGFYVLSRYWMRLDHVVVRLHETRIHHLFGSDHFLREYTRKEEQFDTLFAKGHPKNMANYTNIDTFQHLLPVREAVVEKILLQ